MTTQPTNWALLYREENSWPSDFCEVRLIGTEVWVRIGQVKTWGELEKVSFSSPQVAATEFQRMLDQQIADGFKLTREWHYDPMLFDFELLRKEIREGARMAFTAGRKAHPNEQIDQYALITDSGYMTLATVTNSIQARNTHDINEDRFWNAAEWAYWEGGEHLDIPYRLILTQFQELPRVIEFDDYIAGFEEAAIRALEDLRAEGFWDNENMVVLFQVMDSDYILKAVQRLNPPSLYERFMTWYRSWN